MTAPFEVSRPSGGVPRPLLSALQADTLRALLVAEMRQWVTELAQQATRLAVLTTNPSKDPTGFDRAMSALQMYGARSAIEEIDQALVRIDVGGYGTCQECDRPIPLERLEAIPKTKFCATCPSPTARPLAGLQRRGRGPGRGEHTGAPPAPVGSPQDSFDVASRRTETTRGNRTET
jgi:DnaK suppressor protein